MSYNTKIPILKVAGLSVIVLTIFPVLYLKYIRPSTAASRRDPQAEVSANITFNNVSRDSLEFKNAIRAQDLSTLQARIGTQCTIQGNLLQVFPTPKGRITFLDFAPWPADAVEVLVQDDDYDKFPTLSKLTGKVLLISGKLEQYKNDSGGTILEIKATSPSQIKIVSD